MIGKLLSVFSSKRRRASRGTPLIGNPGDVIGLAPRQNQRPPTFSRATFGKYELQKEKKKWGKTVFIIFFALAIIWIIYESMKGLQIFES